VYGYCACCQCKPFGVEKEAIFEAKYGFRPIDICASSYEKYSKN
jgi:hypothetical protein